MKFNVADILALINIALAIFMTCFALYVVFNHIKRLISNRYAAVVAANAAILSIVLLIIVQNSVYSFINTLIDISPRYYFELVFSIVIICLCARVHHHQKIIVSDAQNVEAGESN